MDWELSIQFRFALWVGLVVLSLVVQPLVWHFKTHINRVVTLITLAIWLGLIATTPADAIRLSRIQSETILLLGWAWLGAIWCLTRNTSDRQVTFLVVTGLIGIAAMGVCRIAQVSSWWAMPLLWHAFSAADLAHRRTPAT